MSASPLKQVPEENQPKQHGLNQREQHTELFPAEPPNPPHGEGQYFLYLILHQFTFCLEFQCDRWHSTIMAPCEGEEAQPSIATRIKLLERNIEYRTPHGMLKGKREMHLRITSLIFLLVRNGGRCPTTLQDSTCVRVFLFPNPSLFADAGRVSAVHLYYSSLGEDSS